MRPTEFTQSADQLKKRVEELQAELHKTMRHLASVQDELNKSMKEHQAVCTHDIYLFEQDSDGHKTVRTYTCKSCGYWTRYCPTNGIIV